MELKPLRKDLAGYVKSHNLQAKWLKAATLFEYNIRYPSLHTELLEPKAHGIYSFRLDRKYRVLFFIDSEGKAEIFSITNHYK